MSAVDQDTPATIVQIGKYYLPEMGGIENNVRQVAQAAARCGNSVVICMRKGRGPGETFKDGDVDVIRLRSRGAIWRQEIVESPVPYLRRLSPELIHFHSPNPLMAFPVLNYLRGTPSTRLIVSHHADLHRPQPIRSIANLAFQSLLQRAERIVSYTRHFAEHSLEIRDFAGKWSFIPHGVDLPIRLTAAQPNAPCGQAQFRVGFLGRIEAWKGVQVILDALVEEPRCTLLIAGDGNFLPNLRHQAERQGVLDRVVFLGRVDGPDRETFFERIDCLVLPSLNTGESFGQTLVEAQLRGIPVIASDLPTGIREICDFGRAGYLFQTGDAAMLRGCLQALYDPEVRRALAESGRRHALSHYESVKVEDKLSNFYRELINPE